MPIEHAVAADSRSSSASTTRTVAARASSSRMLDNYLADIEKLLQHQLWSAALADALVLPHIAVALGDAKLRSSGDAFLAWCSDWVRIADVRADGTAADGARLYAVWSERSGSNELEATAGVPVQALRQLQLRRLARSVPPLSYRPAHPEASDPDAVLAIETCTALVEAAHRWYARHAARDKTVQANLARLAILR